MSRGKVAKSHAVDRMNDDFPPVARRATETPEQAFMSELERAVDTSRRYNAYPGLLTVALLEAGGSLAHAVMQSQVDTVRTRALQVAAVAMRIAIEGDPATDEWRERMGLEKLGGVA